MTEVKLNRTDKRPIAFMGELIYTGNTKDHASTRWDSVRLFRTSEGYVIGVARLTCWEGERDFYLARKFNSKEKLLGYVHTRLGYLEQQISEALGNNGSTEVQEKK